MKKCGSRCHSCPTVGHQHHHPTHGSMCPPRIPPLSQTRNVRFSKTNSPQQVAISPTTYHQPPPPNPSQSTNIGFNSYQQNTHNSHCNTCMHQQQVLCLFFDSILSCSTFNNHSNNMGTTGLSKQLLQHRRRNLLNIPINNRWNTRVARTIM